MTTEPVPTIAPPPSVAAVLGALTEETRIGQVDFSSRLAPEPEDEETAAGQAAADEGVDSDELATEEPKDLEDEDTDDDVDQDDDDDDDDEEADEVVPEQVTLTLAPSLRPKGTPSPARRRQLRSKADPEVTQEPGTAVASPSLTERIHEPARLEDAQRADTAPADERPPSIEEIARLVVERMHDAELAMMRHLEALGVEAARRCELATAQAELDAELIRLNARREAHAIVTAARERAEQGAVADPSDTALDEVTDALTRFADVMDELRPAPRPGHRP